VMIFLGKHQGKYLAGAFVIFWQNRAFYHHGASIKSKVPLSSLLQFFAIKEAIKRRCSFYNFWGIAESEDKSHPWYGLTFFKKGFGGEKKVYLRTKDYPLSFWYLLNYVVEKIRRKKRRLGKFILFGLITKVCPTYIKLVFPMHLEKDCKH